MGRRTASSCSPRARAAWQAQGLRMEQYSIVARAAGQQCGGAAAPSWRHPCLPSEGCTRQWRHTGTSSAVLLLLSVPPIRCCRRWQRHEACAHSASGACHAHTRSASVSQVRRTPAEAVWPEQTMLPVGPVASQVTIPEFRHNFIRVSSQLRPSFVKSLVPPPRTFETAND